MSAHTYRDVPFVVAMFCAYLLGIVTYFVITVARDIRARDGGADSSRRRTGRSWTRSINLRGSVLDDLPPSKIAGFRGSRRTDRVNLGQFLLLVVILGTILGFIGVPWWMSRRRETPAYEPARAYLAAIDALIRGDRPGAIAPLRDLARRTPANIRVYLRLGRPRAQDGIPASGPTELHADLMARTSRRTADLRSVYRSCIEDLLILDRPEDLSSNRREAPRIRPKGSNRSARAGALPRARGRLGAGAFEFLDEWDEVAPGATVPTPAQMRIHMARRHLESGQLREAGKLLDEAIKMAGDGRSARVFLGDLLRPRGKVERLARSGSHTCGRAAIGRLRFSRGSRRPTSRWVVSGTSCRSTRGSRAERAASLHAAVALADMHRRRGRIAEAVRQLETVVEQQGDNQEARRHLIGGLLQIGRTERRSANSIS